MNIPEITYFMRLKVSWLLIWRSALIGAVIGSLFGAVEALVERYFEFSGGWGVAIITIGSFLIGIFFIGPLLIQMLLRKHFEGFRIELVRDPQ